MNVLFSMHEAGGRRGSSGSLQFLRLLQLVRRARALLSVHRFRLAIHYVAPAERADGTHAVLKIGFPEDREFQTEIMALQAFVGEGCVNLLEFDEQHSAALLERIEPGTPLSVLEDDKQATEIITEVALKLHKPLPAEHSFITVDEWAQDITSYQAKHATGDGPLPIKLVEKAAAIFSQLLATSGEQILVHGDLHHDNILYSGSGGWVAIDPKGVAAEPAYEVAAMIINPYPRLEKIPDLENLIIDRIHILSDALELDPVRVHKWCFAQTMLSAVWSSGVNGEYEHTLRVAKSLDNLKI